MSIRDLNQGTPTTAAQIPFYDTANGQDRRCSVGDLAAVLDSTSSAVPRLTQYAAPAASGFTVAITPSADGQNVWLVLLPLAVYATGTITLPALTTLADQQEIEIVSTQNVTALTLAGNGATVNGAPTSLTASVPKKYRFDAVTSTWYPAL